MTAPIDAASFRAAMARFPGAVTIVTALAGTQRRGITATAVCSVTADPPSLLVCLNRATGTCAAVQDSGLFNVNLLPGDDSAMARRFAGMSGVTGDDKFALGDWRPDGRGVPLLSDALLGLSCKVTKATEAGSHCIFIGQIVGISQQEGAALIYERAGFYRLAPI